MQPREERGLVIAALTKLAPKDGVWYVPSQAADQQRKYTVNVKAQTCTCPDHQEAGHKCKHIYAVEFTMKREHMADGTVVEQKTLTFTEKKTYRQEWPAYNEAQATEKNRLQELLFDLCRDLPDLPAPKCGRRPHRTRDAVFAMVFKVYSTFSSRRFSCDLNDAHAKGYLTTTIPGVKVCKFFEMEAFTQILVDLIRKSSLPLASVESDFAVDSSGFSTSRFIRWYDEKYGCDRISHEWVKAHIICGVRTNVITAVEILDKNANDCPQLPKLVNATAKNFTMIEVSADKAYLSHDNLETIAGTGAMPYIPFKANSVVGKKAGMWEKMFYYFSLNSEEFLAHYHKRSNVESTFSMVKAKFRDHVRSKTDVAMKNEVLCKFLCHNICCVIQSECELGIDGKCWGNKPANELPTILPMSHRNA